MNNIGSPISNSTGKMQGFHRRGNGEQSLDRQSEHGNAQRLVATSKWSGLLEVEKKAQDQAQFEKEYLEPIWASAISQAEIFSSRRAGLEVELDRLRQGKKR